MLCMCVYMHFRFIENHPIQIMEDGSPIFEVVLSHLLLMLLNGLMLSKNGVLDQLTILIMGS
jgi:hypothetical protein